MSHKNIKVVQQQVKFNCPSKNLHMIDLNCCDGVCSNEKIADCNLYQLIKQVNSFIHNLQFERLVEKNMITEHRHFTDRSKI